MPWWFSVFGQISWKKKFLILIIFLNLDYLCKSQIALKCFYVLIRMGVRSKWLSIVQESYVYKPTSYICSPFSDLVAFQLSATPFNLNVSPVTEQQANALRKMAEMVKTTSN